MLSTFSLEELVEMRDLSLQVVNSGNMRATLSFKVI
jgi:hypothetical protein